MEIGICKDIGRFTSILMEVKEIYRGLKEESKFLVNFDTSSLMLTFASSKQSAWNQFGSAKLG